MAGYVSGIDGAVGGDFFLDDDDYDSDNVDAAVPDSPVRLDRDGVLAALGYKHHEDAKPRTWTPILKDSELCRRCGKKVYPVEKIDVGALYHRGCFKCKVCGGQLTIQSFQSELDDGTGQSKEVYCKQHVPRQTKGNIDHEAMGIQSALLAQKHASVKLRGAQGEREGWEYDPEALEFQHAKDVKSRRKVKRRSSLKSWQDFENFGVFDAQTALEEIHRAEEDELYRQMFEERKLQMRHLDSQLKEEKVKTVKDLIGYFEKKGMNKDEKEKSTRKVENYFKKQREQRVQLMLRRLASEEQDAVSRMIQKHSQEMLHLIAEKDKQALAETLENQGYADSASLLTGDDAEMPQFLKDYIERIDEDDEDEEKGDEPQKQIEEETSESEEEQLELPESSVPDELRDPSESTGKLEDTQNKPPLESVDVDQSFSSSSESEDYIEEVTEPAIGPTKDNRSDDRLIDQSKGFTDEPSLDERKQPIGQSMKTPPEEVSDDESESSEATAEEEEEEEAEQEEKEKRGEISETRLSGKEPKSRPLQFRVTTKTTVIHEDETSSSESESEDDDISEKPSPDVPPKQPIMLTPRKTPTSHLQPMTQSPGSTKMQIIIRPRGGTPSGTKIVPATGRGGTPSGTKTMPAKQRLADRPVFNFDPLNMSFSSQPDVEPPRTRKSTLYKTPEVFRDQDSTAIRVAKKDHSTFTELVRQLSRRCQNDLQRVRSIFRWITVKDLNSMEFSANLDPNTPIGLLRGIKYGTETYHNLFKRLCSYAGLPCEVIEGYSKGAGYRPGQRLKGTNFRNQWTAVCVDGSWRFINCNWGARHVKGPRDSSLTYQCDEFYFLTDPEEHIYQHYPDIPAWQLLKDTITLDDFMRLPVVKSPFFNCKLSFVRPYGAIVEVADGSTELRLTMIKPTGFAAKLKSKNGHVSSEILFERTLVRTVENEVVFLVNLPSPGIYFMDIYVAADLQTERMQTACSLLLKCSGVSDDAHISYPQLGCFGRTPAAVDFGIDAKSYNDPYVTSHGQLSLAFTIPEAGKISHQLRLWNHRDRLQEEFDRFALLKQRSTHHANYVIRCPRKGLYVFSLFAARTADQSGSNMVCVFRYLIDCRLPTENACPSPKVSKRWNRCKLLTPERGDLAVNTEVRFKIESSVALDMVVIIKDKWKYLKNTSGRLWEGIVHTGSSAGKAVVCGKFDDKTEKYIPLLEYKINDSMDSLRYDTKRLTSYLSYDKVC